MSSVGQAVRHRTLEVIIGIAAGVAAWSAITYGRPAMFAVLALLALSTGVYVGLRHPLALYWALAFVLGALPFGYLPGAHAPLFLTFATAVVLAAVVHPTEQTRVATLELAVVGLMLASAVSLVATGRTTTDLFGFVKWAISTAVVLALLRLSSEHLVRFGQVFVLATAGNALFGMAIVAAYPRPLLKVLGPVGYGLEDTSRYVISNDGVVAGLRLGGTWVDPNAAGLGLLVALAVCLVVFQGRSRMALCALFLIGMAMTLSRASIFSLVAAAGLMMLFHTMRPRDRRWAFTGIAAAVVVGLAIPDVRNRVLMSFTGNDPGSSSRLDALRNFPGQLEGHWIFGLGWGRREYTDGAYAFILNHVANGPLFTVYRGGLIAGLAFVLVFVIGCWVSARVLRSTSFAHALYGAIFIGFTLVALQLDHPVVGVPATTGVLSVLLAFLARLDGSSAPSEPRRQPTATVTASPAA